MKTKLLLIAIITAITLQIHAFNYKALDFPTIEVPEMKAELVYTETTSPATDLSTTALNSATLNTETAEGKWKPDFAFFKQRTNPGVEPYKFMDDMTFVGIPLFAAGWALKSDKAMFRVNNKGGKKNTQLLTDFKTGIDDYLQFFGPAMVVGLKLGGYEGRSDWPRLLASAGMSYVIMAGLVNGIKYTAKEMRPDGSTANSWPSGHTATAFVGATLLHKEYGLTRSPWWSVAGYGVATATGVMRVLNNRHWISDVMSGAGIGIMSTELGYALCDLLFKGKGLLRNDMIVDTEKPSFFGISMGVGLGGKELDFEAEGEKITLNFRAATVVDAEGAYFFNKYIGVGGRLRIRAQSAKDFGDFAYMVGLEDYYSWQNMMGLYKEHFPEDFRETTIESKSENENIFMERVGYVLATSEEEWNNNAPVSSSYGIIKSDHITEFSGSVGVYFNLPLSNRFSLGTKALIGRSMTQELDIDGHAEGNKKDISYLMTLDNRPGQKQSNGDPTLGLTELAYPNNTGEKWTDDWEYLTVGAKSSTTFGTGLSLTFRYKSNFSWRLYVDYDYTQKTYTATYDPYHFTNVSLTPGTNYLMDMVYTSIDNHGFSVRKYETKKNMNYFTLGLSFLVNL